MDQNFRKGAFTSTAIHLVFVAVLLFAAFWEAPREKEPPIFEMVSPPSEVSDIPEPVSEPEPEPEPEPETQMVTFDFEEIPEPEPPPEREPRPRPEPAPPPEPEPEPQPEPEPEPEPERVRFDQFRERNPQPDPQPRPEPEPEPVEVPRIDVSQITQALQDMDLDRETREQVQEQPERRQQEMTAYFQRLRNAVRGAWRQPSGLSSDLEVRVQFSLSSDGRITGARVISSSGNAALDDSVVEAFQRLRTFDPPPDSAAYNPSITFSVD